MSLVPAAELAQLDPLERNQKHPELYYMENGYFTTKEDAALDLTDGEDYLIGLFPVGLNNGHFGFPVYFGDKIEYFQNDVKNGEINDVGYVYQSKDGKGWVAYHIA